jgi:hypothetical protein
MNKVVIACNGYKSRSLAITKCLTENVSAIGAYLTVKMKPARIKKRDAWKAGPLIMRKSQTGLLARLFNPPIFSR